MCGGRAVRGRAAPQRKSLPCAITNTHSLAAGAPASGEKVEFVYSVVVALRTLVLALALALAIVLVLLLLVVVRVLLV